MALFLGKDLYTEKYFTQVMEKIRNNKPILMKDGKSYYIKQSAILEDIFSQDPITWIKLFKEKNRFKPLFDDLDSKKKFKWTDIDKKPFSKGNYNSLGKGLSDLCERTTINMVRKNIKDSISLLDTDDIFFVEHQDLFERWKNTFLETSRIINSMIPNLDEYYLEHDADPSNRFYNTIKKITSINGGSKDSWNPTDLWVIKKSEFENIENSFYNIIKSNNSNKNKIHLINILIIELYELGLLFPFSLKQITTKGKIELSNYRNSQSYNFIMNNFPHDFSFSNDYFNSKEIGLFKATNTITNKQMVFQVRGFPHKFSTVQTEITSSGEESGGRIGKIPTKKMDLIMGRYRHQRIKSIKEFKDFVWDDKDIEYYSDMYEELSNSSYFRDNISYWLELTKTNYEIKTTLAIKLQGLVISYFLYKNQKDINRILNDFLLAAKKIDGNSGFFIKIY